MNTFKKLLFLLDPDEKRLASLLLVMIIIMALLDIIGIASILPFMTVLTNPNLIETNIYLNKLYRFSNIFGVENNNEFLFALGILVFILLVLSLIFKTITTYAEVRFIKMREYTIGKRLVERYFYQPYSWFLNINSADLGKNILSELGQVIGYGINPIIQLFSKGLVTITLIILLIIVDPKLATITGLSLALAYGLIFYFTKNYLNKIGSKRLKNNQLRFKALSEGFGAIKEVKVGGLENIYIQKFSNSAKSIAISQASAQVLSRLPRFILEAIAFGGALLIILYTMSRTGSFNNALPVISLYIFAGYRLLPALQEIYSSLSQLSFVGPALDELYDDFNNLKYFQNRQDKSFLSFKKKISLKNIYYNYPKSSKTVLTNINFDIHAKTIVGLVGPTGSGKTTIVDIILSLLEPQKGKLEVDGEVITKKNYKKWQKIIGYVPQHIFLADDTVAANIAFGVNSDDINQEIIVNASKIANLHEFVVKELPYKYDTKIGERGVRLSGGQRQRIGIARALYHNPKLLILDEATSALDNDTEKAVMDAVNNLNKNITIILIAHRLNTVKKCDVIYKLDKGKIINQGKFNEIIL